MKLSMLPTRLLSISLIRLRTQLVDRLQVGLYHLQMHSITVTPRVTTGLVVPTVLLRHGYLVVVSCQTDQ